MKGVVSLTDLNNEDYKAAEDWLSPLNRIDWYRAFKARDRIVTLRDGRRFEIDYDHMEMIKSTGEKRKLVHVRPADGRLSPRGFFDLKEVTSKQWITEGRTIAEVTRSQ